MKVTPGQQVASGESIAEIKVLDQYKIHASLSEYYIDRITDVYKRQIQAIIRKVCKRFINLIFQVSDKERNG